MKDCQDFISKIKTLKKITPHSKWKSLNRDFLLQEIKQDIKSEPANIGVREYGQFVAQLFGQKVFQPAVLILLMLGIFLTSGLFVNAAFYSLPGDSLYRAKIALEKTQLAITPNDEKKVELKIEFAKKRVEEFDKILAQLDLTPKARTEKINTVVAEFTKNVVAVQQNINDINENTEEAEKERTLRMAVSVSSQTDELTKAIEETATNLTEDEKIEVEEIIAEVVAQAQQVADQVENLEAEGVVEGDSIDLTVEGDESNTEDDSTQQDVDPEVSDQDSEDSQQPTQKETEEVVE